MTPAEAHQLVVRALAARPTPASFLDAVTVKGMIAIWADVLADIDPSDGAAALKRWICDDANAGKRPEPGQIRRIADEARHGRKRHGGDAWGDVLREIGRTGRYRSPQFVDDVTARAVARLGWRELCDSDNAVADRARFVQLYDQLATEAVSDRAVASLPGVARPALPPSAAHELVGAVAKRLGGGS